VNTIYSAVCSFTYLAKRNSQLLCRLSLVAVILALGVSELTSTTSLAQSQDIPRPWPRTCPETDRFGFSLAINWIEDYSTDQLNAGWYHSFGLLSAPAYPGGIGFVQTIRVDGEAASDDKACGKCPTWTTLFGLAKAHPGSLWLVGNEMDARTQDRVDAESYAGLYHGFYRFLKTVDPSSQVAIGGVVQPTPLRLQYLDLILDAYQARYGVPMPIDVFSTHNYVLQEVAGDPSEVWGCGIPPGVPEEQGMLYQPDDHDNMEYWTNHLLGLREWMAERGYRNRPLIVSEYGFLFPGGEDTFPQFTPERVQTFMEATFDWMMYTSDPVIGYPSDGNRLVQAWGWFSLDDIGLGPDGDRVPPWWDDDDPWWLGMTHLFDPDSYEMTFLGLAYSAYAASLSQQSPSVDLALTGLSKTQSTPGPDGDVTVTVTGNVSNWGRDPAQSVRVRIEAQGLPAQESVIPSVAPGETLSASVYWEDLSIGQLLDVTATVNPYDTIWECSSYNNAKSLKFLVADSMLYMPIAPNQW
jgi:hypothetical protein